MIEWPVEYSNVSISHGSRSQTILRFQNGTQVRALNFVRRPTLSVRFPNLFLLQNIVNRNTYSDGYSGKCIKYKKNQYYCFGLKIIRSFVHYII